MRALVSAVCSFPMRFDGRFFARSLILRRDSALIVDPFFILLEYNVAEKSSIAWCKSTFNPWLGCAKVGPGCDHCYAEVSTPSRTFTVKWGAGEPRKRTSPSNWTQPLKWNKQAPESEFAGRKGFWPVFTASLADVFDNEVPAEWRADLMKLIIDTPHLSWLLVTKRIGNVSRMIEEAGDLIDCGEGWMSMWGQGEWPANVRLLITVCNQEEADRDIPKLLRLNCKNGISYEPALGPIDFTQWLAHRYPGSGRTIEWVIIGGESRQGGMDSRPFDLAWARNTIKQCRDASVPVFVKQMGSWPRSKKVEYQDDGFYSVALGPSSSVFDLLHFKDRAGADPSEWPEELRVQEFPK